MTPETPREGREQRNEYRLGVCPHGIYRDTRCFNCDPETPREAGRQPKGSPALEAWRRDFTVCRICGDAEPLHIHNGDQRIEDYFVVGRGETDFDAAVRWKARALVAAPPPPDSQPPEGLREALERIKASDERTGLVVVDVDRAVTSLAAADRAERGLPLDVGRLARAMEATLADAVMAGPGGIRELGDGRTSYWHDRAEAVAEKYADAERAGWYRGPEAEPFA